MSHATRRRGVGLAAALSLAAVLIGTQIAAAEDPPPPPDAGFTIPAGELRLHMSTDAYAFTYADAGGAPVASQGITQRQKCGYNSTPSLVAASATGGSVGFVTGNKQLGVDSKDGATKCTQTNPGESLTLDLANDAGAILDGLYATNVLLDLELKFSPLVTVNAYLDGGATPVWTDTYDCTISDCGPDRDTAGDNAYVRFPKAGTVLFDRLTITATSTGNSTGSAGVSVEGGSDLYQDGTTKDTVFTLVLPAEGELCPGETVTEPTETGTSSVEYLSTTGECKFYNLVYSRDETTNDRELSFITSGTASPGTFEVKVADWDPEPAANPVPLSDTDPAGDDGDPTGEWCEGTSAAPSMPAGESWCAISLTATTYGPDGDGSEGDPDWVPGYEGQLMQVRETWLLVGDAKISR
jgi:hypothetical protein